MYTSAGMSSSSLRVVLMVDIALDVVSNLLAAAGNLSCSMPDIIANPN